MFELQRHLLLTSPNAAAPGLTAAMATRLVILPPSSRSLLPSLALSEAAIGRSRRCVPTNSPTRNDRIGRSSSVLVGDRAAYGRRVLRIRVLEMVTAAVCSSRFVVATWVRRGRTVSLDRDHDGRVVRRRGVAADHRRAEQ